MTARPEKSIAQRLTDSDESGTEYTRIRRGVTNIYLLAYTIPLTATAALALYRGDTILGALLGAFATMAALVMWRIYRHGLSRAYRVFLVCCAGFLFEFLAITGGYEGTGLFWCFTIYVVIYHFSSAKLGLAINLALTVFAGVVLLSPALADLHTQYPDAWKTRFVAVGCITSILIFVYALLQEVLAASLIDAQQRLLRVSLTDHLTGLDNRRAMSRMLESEDSAIHGGRRLAVAIADVDHFKRVNDTHGHHAGDLALRHIANTLNGSIRDTDRIARWGGEEFLILMDVMDDAEALNVGERVRAAVEKNPARYHDAEIKVTVSIGICVITENTIPLKDAIVIADANLYAAKDQGRNTVVLTHPAEVST